PAQAAPDHSGARRRPPGQSSYVNAMGCRRRSGHHDGRAKCDSSGKTGTAVIADRRSTWRREVAERAQWHGDESDEQWAGNGDPLDDAALSGEVNDWYQRGIQLLDSGNPAAATQLLVRAVARVPRSRAVLEALARAHFDAEQYREAADVFRTLADANPDD